jgi:NAD+ kinase
MAEPGFREINRVILFINFLKKDAGNLAARIGEILKSRNVEVQSFSSENGDGPKIEGHYDLAFSLGGDGTVLYAARAMAPLGVPIIPVDLGTLGFIAEVPPGSWALVLEQWIRGTAGISRRLMLEVAVERQGKTVKTAACLNDAVISASGIAKLIRLEVQSETYPREDLMRLGRYRADGLIVATPTGSTAYSMAAGGPILDPELEALIINPVCPFTLSHRPLVLPAREPVIVKIDEEQRSGVLLTVDGQITEALEPGDKIRIRQAPWQVQLVFSERKAFYRALSTKLNWSGIYQDDAEKSSAAASGGNQSGVPHA